MSDDNDAGLDGVERYSREAKLAEIVREIALRRNVYNDLVKQGRMKRVEADKRIEIMVQIAKDYGGTG